MRRSRHPAFDYNETSRRERRIYLKEVSSMKVLIAEIGGRHFGSAAAN
jgi:hypothetical protein